MAIALVSPFRRQILNNDLTAEVTELLQSNLTTMIDLALVLKQAHWNLIGPNFRSFHLELDEIIDSVRDASDSLAERAATLGVAPDGRSPTVAETSGLSSIPCGFLPVSEARGHVADALEVTITQLRSSIRRFGDLDPVTEDLCIGVCGQLEKHLWMVQAQES